MSENQTTAYEEGPVSVDVSIHPSRMGPGMFEVEPLDGEPVLRIRKRPNSTLTGVSIFLSWDQVAELQGLCVKALADKGKSDHD